MKEELAYRRQKVIEDYGAIKGVIENRLATHDVGSAWFPRPGNRQGIAQGTVLCVRTNTQNCPLC